MPRPIDGPIKPPGPIYPPKRSIPKPKTAEYKSAVLAMVDDLTNPTVATVYIENTLPPEDGYTIPSSLGVTFLAAPAAWNSTATYNPGDYASVNSVAYKCIFTNTNSQPPNSNWVTPTGVAFYNDPVLLDGGSWLTVDTVNKVIVNVQQGESNAPPTSATDLFRYIRHDGAYNTTGNFLNPGPIDKTQLSTVVGYTVSTSSVSLGAYTVAGTSVGVPVTLTPTYTAPIENIKEFLIVCAPHGLSTTSQLLFDTQGYPWGSGLVARGSLPNSGTACTINVGGMSAGFAYDLYFYVVGVDGQAIFPSTNPIATTVAQTFQNVAKPAMPAGATVTATGITETLAEGGMKASASIGYSPSVIVTFTLGDTNNPSTTAWAAQLIGFVRQHSTSSATDKTTYQQIATGQITPGNGSSNYVRFNSLTPGQSYDFAFCVADSQGNQTPAVSLVTNYSVPAVQDSSPIGPIIGWRNLTGDTSGDGSTVLVDGGNKQFAYPAMHSALRTGVLQRNLVINGNNRDGGGDINPSVYGWTGSYGGGTCTSNGTYTVNGQTYNAISMPTLTANAGVYQDIPVVPGQTYTYCILVFASAGGQARVFIGNTGFTTQYNSAPGTPLGSPGAFYGGAAAINGATDRSGVGTGRWELIYGTFTVPSGSGNNVCRVLLQNIHAIPTGGVFFAGIQLAQGNRLQDYLNHEPNSSYLGTSAPILKSLPNLAANMLSDVALASISPSAGTLNIWITNAAGTGLPTWTPPDGDTVIAPSSAACGSQSTPLHSFTGLSSTTKYYFIIYYNTNTGAFQNYTTIYSSQPTDAQQAAALADGTIVAATASASTSSGITPSGGGTVNYQPGGGGHSRYQ